MSKNKKIKYLEKELNCYQQKLNEVSSKVYDFFGYEEAYTGKHIKGKLDYLLECLDIRFIETIGFKKKNK